MKSSPDRVERHRRLMPGKSIVNYELRVINNFFRWVIFLIAIVPLIASSPYESGWKTDGSILFANLAIDLIARSTEDNSLLTTNEIKALSREDVNHFDRSATYNYSESADLASDILVNICAAAPALLIATDNNIRSDWKTVSLMYLEMFVLADNLPDIAKALSGRLRPFVYNPEVPLEKKLESTSARRSFFSGHTTMAFAGAVLTARMYSDYYPESKWDPYLTTGLLTTAGLVGYYRYAAGAHYPSDVLVGAVVGSAIGYFIPVLHRSNQSAEVNIQTIPQFSLRLSIPF